MKPWLLTAAVTMPGWLLPTVDRDLDIDLRIAIGGGLDLFLEQRLGIRDWTVAVDGRVQETQQDGWLLVLVLHDHARELPPLPPQLENDVLRCVKDATEQFFTERYRLLRGKLWWKMCRVEKLALRHPPIPPRERTVRDQALLTAMLQC